MKATDILEHEHKMVLLVIGAAEHEARRMRNTGNLRVDIVDRIVDFFRCFADHCHDPKEEDLLFSHLHKAGLSWDEGLLGEVVQEHGQLRHILMGTALSLRAARYGDDDAIRQLEDDLEAYSCLMRTHMEKEEAVLFPMANQLFTDDDQDVLTTALTNIDNEECEVGLRAMYEALAHELAAV